MIAPLGSLKAFRHSSQEALNTSLNMEGGGVLGSGHLCLWNSSTGQSFLQQILSNWLGLCGPASQPEAHLPSPVFLLLSFYRKWSAEWSEDFSCSVWFLSLNISWTLSQNNPVNSEQTKKSSYDPSAWIHLAICFGINPLFQLVFSWGLIEATSITSNRDLASLTASGLKAAGSGT